jgi:predicted kinase
MNRPSLILLVGIPGSCKTTYAEKYIEENHNTVHISSDRIRAELWGNEATQGDSNEVFSLMQSRAIDALNNGQSVVYDATNVTRKDRSYIIAICPKFAKIECHIIWAPIETCIERDAARERTVGKEVIDRMLKRFQAPYYDEGIHEIKIIRPENFNSLQYISNIFEAMKIPHDNPHHTLSIYDHCCEAQDYAYNCGKDDTGLVALAAMVHDAGKPYVKAFVDGKGSPCETAHYYQHHCISAWLAYGIYGASVTVNIAWLCSVHMDPFLNTKYYNKLPLYLKKQVDLLHEADLAAH